jgi:predicted MFS family arabinose efflux permease
LSLPAPTSGGPMSRPLFRRFLLARFVSNLGNGMGPTALAFGVLAIPGADGKDLGFVLAAQAIPLVVLMPLGGVLADRRSRALVIAVTDILLGALVIAEGFLFATGDATVPIVAGINVLAGALNALWWPAFPGLVPAILGDRDLQAGNSFVAIASNVSFIGGSAVAGILVATFGAGPALVVDGASFLVAGLLVFTLRKVTVAEPSGESVLRDLREGWSTFISLRWLWVSVAVWAVINAVFRGVFEVGGPVLMRDAFDGARTWAILQTAMAIGFLAGAAIAARIHPERPLRFLVLVSFGLPLAMLALVPPASFGVLLVVFFAVGMQIEFWGVLWPTVMQTHVPRDRLSRATAFDAFGSNLLGPVGLAVAGPVIAVFGLPTLFVAGAVLAAAMLALQLLEREVRDMARIDPEPEPPVA